ncbi:MAG: hypothetical protein ACRDT6_04055 [Micromonosporaceae bacterium]
MLTRQEQITSQYATRDNLEARRSIYRHRQPPLDLSHEVLRHLDGVNGAVLDVGCGPGVYTGRPRELRPELAGLFRQATAQVTGEPVGWDELDRFTLEDGERLARRHFTDVERIDFRGEVVVPDVTELMGFFASIRELYAHRVPFDAVLRRVADSVAGQDGYRFTSHVGLLVCR